MTAFALYEPYIPTEMYAITSPSSVRNREKCSKCGYTKKSGVLSCCARGGDWFKNCGDAGETHLEHTWAKGVQACKSRL